MLLFLKLYMLFASITLIYWLKQVNDGKISALKTFQGFLVVAIMFIVAASLPFHWIIKVKFIMVGGLILIYAVTVLKNGFGKTEDDARVWIRSTMVLMAIAVLFALWRGRPDTNTEFESMLIGVVSGSLPLLFPVLMNRLNRSRGEESEA